MADPDEDLESTVERLRDRVDDLEAQLAQTEPRSPATATRRDALTAGGAGALLGALGLGSLTTGASADPQGRLGSATNPVQQAYIENADVTALSADDAVIGALDVSDQLDFGAVSRIVSDEETVQNDSAITILSGNGAPKKIEILNNSGVPRYGVFLGNYSSLTTSGEAGMSNEGATELTGTTGPDASLNISHYQGDVMLENRTGSSLSVTWDIKFASIS